MVGYNSLALSYNGVKLVYTSSGQMPSLGISVSYSSVALSYNGVTLAHTSSSLIISTGVTVSYSISFLFLFSFIAQFHNKRLDLPLSQTNKYNRQSLLHRTQ